MVPESSLANLRPMESEYTLEMAARICDELGEGKSLRSVCKQEGFPCKSVVFKWLCRNPEFEKMYRFATSARADAFAEDMLDIADDGSNDWMETNDPDNPGYRFNGEHFQRSRLRVDTRKWNAARMNSKRYGDKFDIAHSGSIETISKEALIERLTGLYAAAVSRIDGSRAEGTAGPDSGVPAPR